MPDPTADPVADLLRRARLSEAQRATLWDAFQAAATADDLATALKPLQIPNPIKADLWDLKAGGRPPAAAPPADDPTRPRTLWERMTGTTTAVPPDIAAENAAMRARMTGQAPPLRGDVVVENVQGMASYGPAVGATIGGIYGGPPGAAAGGAIGEGVNLLLNPAHRSETTLGMAGQVAGEGAIMGATEAVLPVVGRGITRGATAVYRGYLKPSVTEHLAPRAKDIVEAAIREGLPITEAGVDKAKQLITDLNQQISQMLARAGGRNVDLHAIAERVRQFARVKYWQPGRSVENYDAALRVADRIDQHPSLGLPAGARPTRVNVDLPTAQNVKVGLYEEAGDRAFGVATGQATKEAEKQGAHYLRREIETQARHAGFPQVGALNAREGQLIDAAEAIAKAVNREANKDVLLGWKTLAGAAVGTEEYRRTGDPYAAAVTAIVLRQALRPAIASRVAIVAAQLGKANSLIPAAAVRFALQAVRNQGVGEEETTATR